MSKSQTSPFSNGAAEDAAALPPFNRAFVVAGTLVAVGLPLLLSLLFREVLRIPLPQGSWSVLGG